MHSIVSVFLINDSHNETSGKDNRMAKELKINYGQLNRCIFAHHHWASH